MYIIIIFKMYLIIYNSLISPFVICILKFLLNFGCLNTEGQGLS